MTKEQIIKNGFKFNLFGQENVVVTMGTGIPSDMQKHYGDKKVGKWLLFQRDGTCIFRMEQINKNDIEIAYHKKDGYLIQNAFNLSDEELDADVKWINDNEAKSERTKYSQDYYVGIKLLKEYNDAKKYLDRWTFIWKHNKMLSSITKPTNGILSPKQKKLLNQK